MALILFGISYLENYLHWSNTINLIDFSKSVDNYKHYIFDYFTSKYNFNEIDVFFATNILNDNIKSILLETYKPKKYIFVKDETTPILSRNVKLKKAIECCLEYKNIYDLCFITRFDLLFQREFKNINFETFNMISKIEQPQLICDNVYIFPYKYLLPFYNLTISNLNKSFHTIKTDIEQISPIHYLYNEGLSVDKLSFYKIFRNSKINYNKIKNRIKNGKSILGKHTKLEKIYFRI